MDLFEQVEPFVLFSQIVGFFPFRIESNEFKKRFTFAWWLTFWFISALFLQLSPLIGTIFLYNEVQQNTSSMTAPSLPFSLSIVFGITNTTHYIMIAVSRAVSLRYTQLLSFIESLTADAVKALDKFEIVSGFDSSFKKRTFFGLLLILTAV